MPVSLCVIVLRFVRFAWTTEGILAPYVECRCRLTGANGGVVLGPVPIGCPCGMVCPHMSSSYLGHVQIPCPMDHLSSGGYPEIPRKGQDPTRSPTPGSSINHSKWSLSYSLQLQGKSKTIQRAPKSAKICFVTNGIISKHVPTNINITTTTPTHQLRPHARSYNIIQPQTGMCQETVLLLFKPLGSCSQLTTEVPHQFDVPGVSRSQGTGSRAGRDGP